MSLQINEMTASDYDDVFAFWAAQQGVGLGESDGRQQIADYLLRNEGMSLVGWDEGRVIAAVLCGHDGRRGYLHHLTVAESCRRQGIGKLLVQRCLDRLSRDGIPKCNVFIFDDNSDARGFWEAVGFRVRNDLKLLQRETPVAPAINATGLTVNTDRLILRNFMNGDWRAVHVYASDPEVSRYMTWGPNSEQQSREYIERMMLHARQTRRREYELAVVLRESHGLIGGCGLTVEGPDGKEAMLGYCFDRSHWRNGYATEAAGAMLRFGFQTLGVHRIYSTADELNVGSWRVMEKLRMKREGRLREHIWCKGRWRNSFLYSILEDEWR
jgi:ribosomal-protein-alanine N-acetyltransferase